MSGLALARESRWRGQCCPPRRPPGTPLQPGSSEQTYKKHNTGSLVLLLLHGGWMHAGQSRPTQDPPSFLTVFMLAAISRHIFQVVRACIPLVSPTHSPPAPAITLTDCTLLVHSQPCSPRLRSRQRAHTGEHKTSEQLELERVEQEKVAAAALRRHNAETFKHVLGAPPPPVVHSSRPLTEPVAVELSTSRRRRMHSMETRSMVREGGVGWGGLVVGGGLRESGV